MISKGDRKSPVTRKAILGENNEKMSFFISNICFLFSKSGTGTTREMEDPMLRPVTLFTGQWADLPLEILCEKVLADTSVPD